MICSFEIYVSECYKDHLKRKGKPSERLLADMDVEEALDMLSAQGKWSKCLDVARPHGQAVLHKYVALYATDLLKVRRPDRTENIAAISSADGLVGFFSF